VPELVEVELYRRAAERILGLRVVRVHVLDPHCLAGFLTPSRLEGVLRGSPFRSARRRGKLLLLDAPGATLGLHFGMTGVLIVDGRAVIDRLLYAPAADGSRWIRMVVELTRGHALALRDPRRLARVVLDPDEDALGPDALTVSLAQLRGLLQSARRPGPALKARLLDQRHLAGVGNLLADEILWRSSLSPLRPATSLDEGEIRRLHRHLRATLQRLLGRGGSHLGTLMPHRRAGGRCPVDGAPLRADPVGGRTSWWCPKHQH
jgi:formamidopyrimidine-DNA glycosylase